MPLLGKYDTKAEECLEGQPVIYACMDLPSSITTQCENCKKIVSLVTENGEYHKCVNEPEAGHSANFKCDICMDDCLSVDKMMFLVKCGHGFCLECMKAHVSVQTTEASLLVHVENIVKEEFVVNTTSKNSQKFKYKHKKVETLKKKKKRHAASRHKQGGSSEKLVDRKVEEQHVTYGVRCPHPGCKCVIEVQELQRVADTKVLDRFCDFALNDSLDRMADLTRCASCGGYEAFHCETRIMCNSCGWSACAACKFSHDAEEECSEYSSLHSELESLTAAWAEHQDARNCPHCSVLIEKNAGCNHMRCVRCQKSFLWNETELVAPGQTSWSKRPPLRN